MSIPDNTREGERLLLAMAHFIRLDREMNDEKEIDQ